MNILSLVTLYLDNVCQIKTKCYSNKNENFCKLNKAAQKRRPATSRPAERTSYVNGLIAVCNWASDTVNVWLLGLN